MNKRKERFVSGTQRDGVLVTPYHRLTAEQVKLIDGMSRELLEDPGLLCYNLDAAEIFRSAGAKTEDANKCVRVRLASSILDRALASAPSEVVLGARNPDNRLVLDAHEPRVRFGSGSESNVWLEVAFDGKAPRFIRRPGTIRRLADSAHLAENLDNLDIFIRNVNIQDDQVTEANKDVNKLLASLNNTTKHVQAGLTSLEALDDVVRMGRIIAGGQSAFEQSPVLSFITCAIKSPLQMVRDTAETLIEVSRRRIPVVVSSCPMGGATGPFDELGMVAQINAELLAGVVLNQLVAPGAPVLYGACPTRTRLDNLNDMYGAAEAVHYCVDCAQMARLYGLPCYTSAGVGDSSLPGIQTTVEKMLTLLAVPQSGAQYVHYAFGLLERTNVFCPEQAILDDAHIGLIKETLRSPQIAPEGRQKVLATIREVMQSSHKTYMYHLPLPSRQSVYTRYPLEDEAGALHAAHQRYHEILKAPREEMPSDIQQDLFREIPNILPQTMCESARVEA
jgi:trimethylamine--corrinoid protein Co-methyltransferase